MFGSTCIVSLILAVSPVSRICFNDVKAIAEPLPGQTQEVKVADGLSIKFCWIPSGDVQLGSTEAERRLLIHDRKKVGVNLNPILLEAESTEKRGKFKTNGFWLAKFEVTQEQWQAVMGKNPSDYVPTHSALREAGIKDTKKFPVEMVSWNDCQDFLKKLNRLARIPEAMGKGTFCLPHEDQWEYAARGGKSGEVFYTGAKLNSKLANCDGENPIEAWADTKGPSLRRPTIVGSYEKLAPHRWGLCDMVGNVDEWCSNSLSDKSNYRARRGGSFCVDPEGCRSACRAFFSVNTRSDFVGLRVAFLAN